MTINKAIVEIPNPIDFHLPQDAKDWESTAMGRPFRLDMFEAFENVFKEHRFENALELGSGPGFLAKHLCERVPDVSLTLLDFSQVMHDLARVRLKDCGQPIRFICRDFKHPDWARELGSFNYVFSNQAIHELRHKSLAANLHRQVKEILVEGGVYLVCDHFFGPGGMENEELFLTPDEQVSSLQDAGFSAQVLLRKGSLQLVQAI